jgi:hypothetical protein
MCRRVKRKCTRSQLVLRKDVGNNYHDDTLQRGKGAIVTVHDVHNRPAHKHGLISYAALDSTSEDLELIAYRLHCLNCVRRARQIQVRLEQTQSGLRVSPSRRNTRIRFKTRAWRHRSCSHRLSAGLAAKQQGQLRKQTYQSKRDDKADGRNVSFTSPRRCTHSGAPVITTYKYVSFLRFGMHERLRRNA